MAIFKCKMCGGALEIEAGKSVITCEYCETTQTLPRLDDERRANLYDRANHYRRNNDYDKAMREFEKILDEDKTDFEAYWSIVLCRYGIEYVKDPQTGKYMPTINRMQKASVIADADYKAAIEYADESQKQVLTAEANAILAIQKEIAVIVRDEKPFDVFICYKETDATGRRSRDSVLAQELYGQLTNEGFKVFFARITLEDKLGSAYEPYIFSALNSSKVMVVIGTCAEHFNAVWVRNEWSRYLALIQNGEKKVLIPAYKDMDPYDMPEEFSHLQAQDMDKLGFMQDLVRGINKIIGKEKAKPAAAASSGNATVDSLLKRSMMFLEDGDWEKANEYCEKILDIDPENAQAYLAKLCVELKLTHKSELSKIEKSVAKNPYFNKAYKFANESLKIELTEYEKSIQQNIKRKAEALRQAELQKKQSSYEQAEKFYESGNLVQAAKCYFRAGATEKVYSTYNFIKKFSIRNGIVSVTDSDTIDISSGLKDMIGDARKYEKCTMVSLSNSHFVGLRNDGTVVACGDNKNNCCMVGDWKNIVNISSADGITVGITDSGNIVSTASQYNNLEWFEVKDVIAQENYIVALKQNGTVVVSDSELDKKVADWRDVVFIAANGQNIAGIKKDGTIVATTSLPEYISQLTDAVNIAWKGNKLYAVDCRGKVHGDTTKGFITKSPVTTKECHMCGYISETDFSTCPECGTTSEESILADYFDGKDVDEETLAKIGNSDQVQEDDENTEAFVYALCFNKQGKKAYIDNELYLRCPEYKMTCPVVYTNGTSKEKNDISEELKKVCDSVVNYISSEFKPDSQTRLVSYSRNLKRYYHSDEDSIEKQFEKVYENKEVCLPCLYRKLIELGYTSVSVESKYKSETHQRTKSNEEFQRELDNYYKMSDAAQGYFNKPSYTETEYAYYYGITVNCVAGSYNIVSLKPKKQVLYSSSSSASKSKPSSGGMSYTTKKKIKKFIKWVITLAVLAVAAVIVISMISSGRKSEEEATNPIDVSVSEAYAEPTEYYIMSSDYTSINIRTQANSDCSVLTKVTSRETKLVPTGETSGKWIQITVNGETGWVHNSVVEYVD